MLRVVSLPLAVALTFAAFSAQAFVVPGSGLAGIRHSLASRSHLVARRNSPDGGQDDIEGEEGQKAGYRVTSEGKKAPTWMFNEKGVAYAPWMVDAFDPEMVKKREEAAEARRLAREAVKPSVTGALAQDPQAMELSGVGLRTKVIDGEVELSWRTENEEGNLGFTVIKRRGKTDEWMPVASYSDWAPLNSKGPSGGLYTFMDPTSEEGTWIYRVSDVNVGGQKNDLCQALVEVQSSSESVQVKVAVAGIVAVLIGAVGAAALLDPLK